MEWTHNNAMHLSRIHSIYVYTSIFRGQMMASVKRIRAESKVAS